MISGSSISVNSSNLISFLASPCKLTIVNEAGVTRVGVLEGNMNTHLATMSWHTGPDLVTALTRAMGGQETAENK